MTEKRLIQYKVLCDDYEEVRRILFEIIETGEEIEGYHQIQEWVDNLYKENEQLKQSLSQTSRELQYGVKKVQKLAKENEQLKSDNKCYVKRYSELFDDYIAYKKENKQLKQQLMDCKKDEKELSISFMEYKMQLIDVLQQNYNYAYNQRQRNLDKSMVARTYEALYQTIYNIAEVMNVDIERFPKGDVE